MGTQGGITFGADNNNDDYCDGDDMITTMITIMTTTMMTTMIKIRQDGHRTLRVGQRWAPTLEPHALIHCSPIGQETSGLWS